MNQANGPRAIRFDFSFHRKQSGLHRRKFFPNYSQRGETKGRRYASLLACALLTGLAAITASGAHAAAGTLSFSPSAANFGNVQVGNTKSISVTVTNTGTASVAFRKESLQANMYTLSGLTLPLTLSPGAHLTFTVKFAPLTLGTISGRVVFGSNATNSLVYFALTGTGVRGALTITPETVNFGSVPLGTTVSQTEQLKNTGTTSMTISGAKLTGGSEFKLCSLTYPITLAVGQSVNCTVRFSATATGSTSGSVAFTNNVSGNVALAMTGAGVADTRTLSAAPASLNFGSVTTGKSETLSVKLENIGNSSVTVSGISVSGVNLTTGGGVSGATIASGQTATLNVTFTPSKTETLSGSVTLTSNASNSPTKIVVAGAGVAAGAYSVSLHWTASTSSGIVGYNVYRALQSSTTYSKLNASPMSDTSYVDSLVTAGESYTYHVTAVNSQGEESAPCSPVSATIP